MSQQQFPVTFSWDDAEKRVLRFTARGSWNWKDFYRAAHVARFAIPNAAPQVDIVVDLTQATRTPAGFTTHIRAIGKPDLPQLTGRVIIIGLERALVEKLAADGATLSLAPDHTVYFVPDEAAAQRLLRAWHVAP